MSDFKLTIPDNVKKAYVGKCGVCKTGMVFNFGDGDKCAQCDTNKKKREAALERKDTDNLKNYYQDKFQKKDGKSSAYPD